MMDQLGSVVRFSCPLVLFTAAMLVTVGVSRAADKDALIEAAKAAQSVADSSPETPAKSPTAPKKMEAQTHNGHVYLLIGPKDYDPTKTYPLVIYLHGGGGGRDPKNPSHPPAMLQGEALQKGHPAFVYVPQGPRGWRSAEALKMLVETVEHLKTAYPVDPSRLYLAGFSMGGSGSYYVARHFYEQTGVPLAAVVRCAGQSDYPMETHRILAKSSVWIQIGGKDAPKRVDLAKDSYEKLRQIHYSDAAEADRNETSEDLVITDGQGKKIAGSTRTLSKDGVVVARISLYPDEGHTTFDFPFRNPQVFEWMFAQKAPLKEAKSSADTKAEADKESESDAEEKAKAEAATRDKAKAQAEAVLKKAAGKVLDKD